MNTPELIKFKEAAKLLGWHYETFKRKRAMGYLDDIEVYPSDDVAQKTRTRQRIVKESVLEHLKRHTV